MMIMMAGMRSLDRLIMIPFNRAIYYMNLYVLELYYFYKMHHKLDKILFCLFVSIFIIRYNECCGYG